MPVNVKPLFDKIMKDPDVIPEEGQEKEDMAMSMVLQRATQSINNEKALSMANSDTSVSKLLDFIGISKAESTEMPEDSYRHLSEAKGYTDEAIENIRRTMRSSTTSNTFDLSQAKVLDPAKGKDMIPDFVPPKSGSRGSSGASSGGSTGYKPKTNDKKDREVATLQKPLSDTTNVDDTALQETYNGEVEKLLDDKTSEAVKTQSALMLRAISNEVSKRGINLDQHDEHSLPKTTEELREDDKQGKKDWEDAQKAEVQAGLPKSELPDFRRSSIDNRGNWTNHAMDAMQATSEARTDDPDKEEKEYMKLSDHMEALIGPIAEQSVRNEHIRNDAFPKDDAKGVYKNARTAGWQDILSHLLVQKPKTNEELYSAIDELAEQVQSETEALQTASKDKRLTNVFDADTKKSYKKATTDMKKIWTPKGNLHNPEQTAATEEKPEPTEEKPEPTKQPDSEVIARNKSGDITYDYRIGRAGVGKYQVQLRRSGSDNEWESAGMGSHSSKKAARNDFPNRFRGDIQQLTNVNADLEQVIKGHQEKKTAQDAEKTAQQERETDASKARETHKQSLIEELKGVKFDRQTVAQASSEGSEKSTLPDITGHSYGGLLAHNVGKGNWQITHIGSGLRMLDGFTNLADIKAAIYQMSKVYDFTKMGNTPAEANATFKNNPDLKKKIESAAFRLQREGGHSDVSEFHSTETQEPTSETTDADEPKPSLGDMTEDEKKEEGWGVPPDLIEVFYDDNSNQWVTSFQTKDGDSVKDENGNNIPADSTNTRKEALDALTNKDNRAYKEHDAVIRSYTTTGKVTETPPPSGRKIDLQADETPSLASTENINEAAETPDERAERLAAERDAVVDKPAVDEAAPEVKQFKGSNAAKKAFMDHFGEDFNTALEDGRLDPPKGKDKWDKTDATAHVNTLQPEPTKEEEQESDKDTTEKDPTKDTTEGDKKGEQEVPPEKPTIQSVAAKLGLEEARLEELVTHHQKANDILYPLTDDYLKHLDELKDTDNFKAARKELQGIQTKKKAFDDAAKAKIAADTDAEAKTKTKDAEAAANDGKAVNALSTVPDGLTKQDATDMYRGIAEHMQTHEGVMKDGTEKTLEKAKAKLVEQGADAQGVDNRLDQHKHHRGTEEGDKAYGADVDTHKQSLVEEDDYKEHVSGQSGSEARKNAFENNDHGRLVHTDDDGNVTHSELMHSNFHEGRKKVEEKEGAGATAHVNDHEEVHGGDETIKGKRGTQTHHDWDVKHAGNQDMSEAKQKYSSAKEAMQDAQKADNPEEVENQKKIMEDLDKENGGALSTMMSDTEKEQQRIDRGQPPGPPPRSGLVWAASIHHWVTPDKLTDVQSGLGDGEGMHINPNDFNTQLGDTRSNSVGDGAQAHADGSFGHQGAVHVTKFGLHRVSDLPDGTPAKLDANLSGSAKHGSPADLASQSLAHALAGAGLMRSGLDEEGNVTTEHGATQKVTAKQLGDVGAELHGTSSHSQAGRSIRQPSTSPYVREVQEIASSEPNTKAKAKLKTALGRFRAIAAKQTAAIATGKAPFGLTPGQWKGLGRGAKKQAQRAARGGARGGMKAARALRDELQGEYAGSSSPMEDLKIFGRTLKREAKEVGKLAPIVGPEAGARKGVSALISHVKRGHQETKRKTQFARASKDAAAKQTLGNKPTEE